MMLRLLADGLCQLLQQILPVKSSKGNFRIRMKTWLNLSVAGETNPVAGLTKIMTDGCDQANPTLGIRQLIKSCNTAVAAGDQAGKLLQNALTGKEGAFWEGSRRSQRHQLNKAYLNIIFFCQLGKICNFIIIKAADQNGIDLNGPKSCFSRSLNTGKNLLQRSPSCHALEFIFLQRIQRNIHSMQACFGKILCHLLQKEAICCQGNLSDSFYRGNLLDQRGKAFSDERFPTGNSNLFDAQAG